MSVRRGTCVQVAVKRLRGFETEEHAEEGGPSPTLQPVLAQVREVL